MNLFKNPKVKKAVNIIAIFVMFAIPFIFLINSFNTKVALTSVYLAFVLFYMAKFIQTKNKNDRNVKFSVTSWANLKQDAIKEAGFAILSEVIVILILLRFIWGSVWGTWGNGPTALTAVLGWFGAIEAIALMTVALIFETGIKLAIVYVSRYFKKMISNTFKMFRSVIKNIVDIAKAAEDFFEKILKTILISFEKNLLNNVDKSSDLYELKNTNLITLQKKATWPPLF